MLVGVWFVVCTDEVCSYIVLAVVCVERHFLVSCVELIAENVHYIRIYM